MTGIGDEFAQAVLDVRSSGNNMRKIRNVKSVPCAFCGGSGTDRKLRTACRVCSGYGKVSVTPPVVTCLICSGRGRTPSDMNCLVCKGVGVVSVRKDAASCHECGGRGRIGEGVFTCTKCRGQGIC